MKYYYMEIYLNPWLARTMFEESIIIEITANSNNTWHVSSLWYIQLSEQIWRYFEPSLKRMIMYIASFVTNIDRKHEALK